MLETNSKNIRFLAHMGSRGVLGQAIYDYLLDGNEIFALSADLCHASGYDRIERDFPDYVVDVGIAEQNLVGIAAGLSKGGIPSIATSWSTYTSARVADQVRNFMGFMQCNVKLVGMDSGFSAARYDYSHAVAPDIAIMRAIPGITILCPSDGISLYQALYQSFKSPNPYYIRLTGGKTLPIIHTEEEYKFEIGKGYILREGTDIALISTGVLVYNCLKASQLLEQRGIHVKVIEMPTIEPLDYELLNSVKDSYATIVTVEDHLLHGGFGAAIAEYYSKFDDSPRQVMLGVDGFYPKAGSSQYLEDVCRVTPAYIADRIMKECIEE